MGRNQGVNKYCSVIRCEKWTKVIDVTKMKVWGCYTLGLSQEGGRNWVVNREGKKLHLDMMDLLPMRRTSVLLMFNLKKAVGDPGFDFWFESNAEGCGWESNGRFVRQVELHTISITMEADITFMKGSQDRFLGDTSSKWDLYIFFLLINWVLLEI